MDGADTRVPSITLNDDPYEAVIAYGDVIAVELSTAGLTEAIADDGEALYAWLRALAPDTIVSSAPEGPEDKLEIQYLSSNWTTLTATNVLALADRATYTIRVYYKGDSLTLGETSLSDLSIKIPGITVEKAPVKVTVNSQSVFVDTEEEEMLPIYSAARTDKVPARDVTAGAYVVYAGLSSNATLDLYLTIPESVRKGNTDYTRAAAILDGIGFPLDGTAYSLRPVLQAGQLGRRLRPAGTVRSRF